MDIASEMIHSLLPVFLVTVLNATTATVGLIEGLGDATASTIKLFSGWISDRFGKRKALTVVGYTMAALAKPLFAVAPTAAWILAARVVDRTGKGIRDTPRDALLGDIVPTEMRGAAYGLRQALDTAGALAGPLLALAFMEIFDRRYRLVFSLAIIPAALAVLVLILGVHDPGSERGSTKAVFPLRYSELQRVEKGVLAVIAVGVVLTLARFSEAFLLLRARGLGLPTPLVPLVMVVMNAFYAASAYPMGAWSDRIDRRTIVVTGFGVLILADWVLALAPGIITALLGAGLWGLHMGMTQGVLSALVADRAPAPLRGSVFGLFNFATGMALLLASVIAGFLWEMVGPAATFMCGSAFAALGIAGIARAQGLRSNSS